MGRGRLAGLRVLCAGALIGVVGACAAAEPTPPLASDGPLRFPPGYGAMLAPIAGGAFSAFDGCLVGPRDRRMRIVEVAPVELSGAESVEFLVGWPTEKNPLRIGAGPLPAPRLFGSAEGSQGRARSCAHPPAGLQFAVVLPPAVKQTVVVKGVTVTYRIGDRQYREVADVTLGLCAQRPAGSPHPDCA